MLKKNLFKILLLTLALAQHCLAKPTSNEIATQTTPVKDLCNYQSKYKAMQPSENDNQLAPSIQLLKFTLAALMDIWISYVEKAKLISEKVLKDPEIVNIADNVEEVQDFKQKLLQFEEGYRKCDDVEQLFEIAQLFSTITSDFYDQEEEGKLSADGRIILKALKKYDTHKADDEYQEDFNKFITKFEEKYKPLKEAMKVENKELMQKVNQWYEGFKDMKTYEEKVEAIAKFTELYGIESED